MAKEISMQDLLDETLTQGCLVKAVSNPQAIAFIDGITKLYQEWLLDESKRRPDCSQAARILMREWSIDIDRRKLNAHARGECKCPTK